VSYFILFIFFSVIQVQNEQNLLFLKWGTYFFCIPKHMLTKLFILFLNHDYTEEDEEDEFKVFLFHLIHLLQCNHGSKTEYVVMMRFNNVQMIIINGMITPSQQIFGFFIPESWQFWVYFCNFSPGWINKNRYFLA